MVTTDHLSYLTMGIQSFSPKHDINTAPAVDTCFDVSHDLGILQKKCLVYHYIIRLQFGLATICSDERVVGRPFLGEDVTQGDYLGKSSFVIPFVLREDYNIVNLI
jgi:hypothetical protein